MIGNGTVIPRDAEYIVSRAGGELVAVNVKSGDSVSKGQSLFEIDNEELLEDFGNKKIAVDEAKAALDAKASDIKTNELQLQRAVLEAESAYNTQNTEYMAYTDLQEKQKLPVPAIVFKQSEIRALQLKKTYELELTRLDRFRESMKTQLDQYKDRLELADNIFKRARARVDGLKIKAKSDGVIQDVDLKPGQRVEIGTSLALITNPHDIYVRLKLPAVQAGKIALGQKASITIGNDVRSGKVIRIDPNVKGTTIDVDIELADSANLRSNMFVSGKVVVQEIANTLFVEAPSNAIENGVSSFYRVAKDGAHLELVKVKTGLLSAGQIEVQSGLLAGDKILISESGKLGGAERIALH